MKVKMPKGTKCMANGGPTDRDPKKMTAKEWNDYNEKMGYKPHPTASPGAKGHLTYYDPKKWKMDVDPTTNQVNSSPIDPNYKSSGMAGADLYTYDSYEKPTKSETITPVVQKTVITPTSNRKVDVGQSFTTITNADGSVEYFDNTTKKKINPLSNQPDVSKDAVATLPDEFADGGKIPKKSKWAQHLNTGGGVTPSAGTTDTTKKEGGNLMGNMGASMGWMQYANMAQSSVRNNIDKEEVVDPKTGKVYSNVADKENGDPNKLGMVAEATAKPAHETWLGHFKNKDYKRLAQSIFLTPMGDNLIANKGKIQNLEFEQAKGRANVNDAAAKRDIGMVAGDENRTYTMADGGKVSSAYKRWTSGKAEGGDIKGPGGPKEDAIPSKLAPGGFVVPAENADKAQEIRDTYFPGTDGKANLKQKGGAPVMVSNGEHYFTPEECKTLKEKGIDLYALAPNAKKGAHKKHGGDIDSMLDSYNTKHLNRRIKEVGREKAIAEYNEIFNEQD